MALTLWKFLLMNIAWNQNKILPWGILYTGECHDLCGQSFLFPSALINCGCDFVAQRVNQSLIFFF